MFENYYKMLNTETQFTDFSWKTRGRGNAESRFLLGLMDKAKEGCL